MHDQVDVASDALAAIFRAAEEGAARFCFAERKQSAKTLTTARIVKRGAREKIMMIALRKRIRCP
jgi:hypothetical protein